MKRLLYGELRVHFGQEPGGNSEQLRRKLNHFLLRACPTTAIRLREINVHLVTNLVANGKDFFQKREKKYYSELVERLVSIE